MSQAQATEAQTASAAICCPPSQLDVSLHQRWYTCKVSQFAFHRLPAYMTAFGNTAHAAHEAHMLIDSGHYGLQRDISSCVC
jgi:hypothetical protein